MARVLRGLTGPGAGAKVPPLFAPEDAISANEKRSTESLADTPYERIVEELDRVVQQLEAGELSLEDSLRAFERGVQLAAAAEARLEQAEQRVEVLQGDRTVPLPPLENQGARRGVVAEDDDAPF